MSSSPNDDPGSSDENGGDPPSFLELLLQTAAEVPGGYRFLFVLAALLIAPIFILGLYLGIDPLVMVVILAGCAVVWFIWAALRR